MGDPLKNYDNQDVILVGETHSYDEHIKLERETALRTSPRYILSEGLDQREPEDMDGLISKMKVLGTPRKIKDHFEQLFEGDTEYTHKNLDKIYEEATQDIEDNSNSEQGYIPESYEEFLGTPIPMMNYEIGKTIQDSIMKKANEITDEIDKWVDFTSEETKKDQKHQYLLQIYSEVAELNHTSTNSVLPLADIAANYRLEDIETDLAGCDIDKSERYEGVESASMKDIEQNEDGNVTGVDQKAIYNRLEDTLQLISDATKEEERQNRDTIIAERITQFNKQNDTNRPIMAVVGSNHLQGVKENIDNNHSVLEIDLTQIKPKQIDKVESLRYASKLDF